MITSRATGCLFCGNEQGRFDSEEHIIALALGNTLDSGLVVSERVIPPGEVCDKCNRRRLSLRDKALAEWPPISMFRALGQIANRRGQLVDAVPGTRWRISLDPTDPRRFRLHVTADTGPDSGRDDVARALCKVAVETRWLDDPADARSERWDEIVAAAIGGPLPASLVMGLSYPSDPEDVDLRPDSDVLVDESSRCLRMVCQLWVVGLRLVLLVNSPIPPLPRTAWWAVDSETGRLRGPDSMWANIAGGAQTARRLMPASDEPPAGRRSQLPTHEANTRLYLQPGAQEPRPHDRRTDG